MREEDGAMVVGRRHSMKGHNNQPNIGVCNGDEIGEGVRLWWNVFGGCFTFVWGDKLSGKNKQKYKYVTALDLQNDIKKRNNQQMSGLDGREMECDE